MPARPPSAIRHQGGAALLVVLVIVAIAVVLAERLLGDSQRLTAASEQLLRQQQAWRLQQGLEDWAVALLRRDFRQQPLQDSRDDFWQQGLPPTAIPGGLIAGELVELNGRFNINTLLMPTRDGEVIDPLQLQRLQRLLGALGIDPTAALQAADWIDRDRQPRPGSQEPHQYGAGDQTDARQSPTAANRPFQHPGQLRWLPALDEAALQRLLPHISTLPRTGINVNTAAPQVLATLADDLNSASHLATPPAGGWSSVADFLAQPRLQDWRIDPTGLQVSSEFFLVHGRVSSGARQYDLFSLLRRSGNSYHVLYRRLGSP